MGFQEKYDEYKQKKEAREFFNQNNDTYITPIDLVKASIVGLLVATVGGFLSQVIGNMSGFNFSIVYIFIGLATSISMKRVINNSGFKLAIAVVIVYFIGMIIGTCIYWLNTNNLLLFDFDIISYYFKATLEYLFTGSIFSTVMLCIGAVVGYGDAQK